MANELDEMTGPVNPQGHDVNVINKQLPVKVGFGSLLFEIMLWVLGIIPGIVFLFLKMKAKTYLLKLQQKLQHDASQIDNYLEQRVVILQNTAKLLDKSIELDKSTFTEIAALRSGAGSDGERNEVAQQVDKMYAQIRVAMENYPELQAHQDIQEAMRQNSYLQKEITAARELYNDTVNLWNTEIYSWPTKMIVAARAGYTTRIPFTTTAEIKEQARGVFF